MVTVKRAKAIILIGGSFLQLPIIRWARELGLHVIVTDKNPDVQGRMLADQFINIDGTDVQSFLALAKRVTSNYDLIGVYGGSDFALPVVAAVSDAYGLPSPSLSTVRLALDKASSQQRWVETGLSTPCSVTVLTLNEAREAVAGIGYPVIVKPVDSSGSRGVSTAKNNEALEISFKRAQCFSKNVIIEQLVIGRHIDVNGLFVDKEFLRCGIDERFFTPTPLHIPLWLYQPAIIAETEEDACYQLLEKAARSLGIKTGPVKADLILTKEGPIIIELAPRFHGEVTTAYVTPEALQSNPIKAFFASLSGVESPRGMAIPQPRKLAGWHAVFPKPGIVKTVNGLGELLSMPGVYEVMINIKEGDSVRPHYDNTTVAGFIWAYGLSLAELQLNLQEALKNISIVVEK